MATAAQIESLDCGAEAAAMVAVVMRVRFDEMMSYRGAASQPDGIDGVHDMRVASRRFRSLLRDFSPLFEKKPLKALKKEVKKLAAALGALRDVDVAIVALETLNENPPGKAIAMGVDRLISRHGASRSSTYQVFLTDMSPGSVARLKELLTAALETLSNRETGGIEANFWTVGRDAINTSLVQLLDHSRAVYDPLNTPALHKLRIAVKRLRYALELFDPCSQGKLSPFAKKLKKIQSRLGAIHDFDAWIEQIGAEMAGGHLDPATGDWLIAQFLGRRTEEYTETLALWNDWSASDLTAELRSILER